MKIWKGKKMRVNGTEYNTGNIIYTTRGADIFHFSENGIMSMIIEDFEVSNGKVCAIEHSSFMDKSIELGISTTYKLRDNAVTALRLKRYSKDFFNKYDNLTGKDKYMYYNKFEEMEKVIHEYDSHEDTINFDSVLDNCNFKEPKIIIREEDMDLDR